MINKQMFKVRRKKDGLFLKKGPGPFLSSSRRKWTKDGSVWQGITALKLAAKHGSLHGLHSSKHEIVIFEFKETGKLNWGAVR